MDEYSGTIDVSENGLMNLFGKFVTGTEACEILGILAGVRYFILNGSGIGGLLRQNASLLFCVRVRNE